MRQPEIGKQITELRKQQGLTQEELAYRCRLNVRSIQRIETGEVVPRLSTLKLLPEVLEFEMNFEGTATTNTWLLLLHLSSVILLV